MTYAEILLEPAEVYPRLIRASDTGRYYAILAGALGSTAEAIGATVAEGLLAASALQPGQVVDDLVSGGVSVPLSAEQGVVLAGLLAAKETPAGAQAKVDAHEADGTSVHGIGDTSQLRTVTEINALIDAAVNGLIDGAPGTIDTLNELAAALGDDPNFAATVTAEIATKVAKATFGANSILKANTAATPESLTIGEQTLVGRITGGQIAALTVAQIRTMINVEDGATGDQTATEITALLDAYFGNTEWRTGVPVAFSDLTDKASADLPAINTPLANALAAKETPSGAQAKADAAQAAAEGTAAADATAKVDAHESDGTNVHGIADTSLLRTEAQIQALIDAAVAAVIDGAPGAIDTLNELAAAMGDDPNFATTVTNAIAEKVAMATFTANTILKANTSGVPEALTVDEARIIGRATGGQIAALTAAQILTMLNVEAGANNYVHPNHSGDVTSTGDGATVIANDAVTNDKAADMASQTIKGRNTAATGDPEDLTPATVKTMLSLPTNTVSDLAAKETPAGAQSKADAAQAAAEATAAGALSVHEADTTNVHGIADTSLLRTEAQIQSLIDAAVAAVIDGAPGAIDTLNELAAALGDDPNFATTVTNSLAEKVAKATFGAHSILKANTAGVPESLTIGEQTLIGRITGGQISALTTTQIRTLINVEDGATADLTANEIEALLDAYYGNTDWRTGGGGGGAYADLTDYDTVDIAAVNSILAGQFDAKVTLIDASTAPATTGQDPKTFWRDDTDGSIYHLFGGAWVLLAGGAGGGGGGAGYPIEFKAASFDAVVGERYAVTATATVSDPTSPTPVDGDSYEVTVHGGTVTVGGTGYTQAGQVLRRQRRSGAWQTVNLSFGGLGANADIGPYMITANNFYSSAASYGGFGTPYANFYDDGTHGYLDSANNLNLSAGGGTLYLYASSAIVDFQNCSVSGVYDVSFYQGGGGISESYNGSSYDLYLYPQSGNVDFGYSNLKLISTIDASNFPTAAGAAGIIWVDTADGNRLKMS